MHTQKSHCIFFICLLQFLIILQLFLQLRNYYFNISHTGPWKVTNEKRRNWESFYLLFSFWLRHRLCFHIFPERVKSFQNSSERVKNLFSFTQKSSQISFISCTLSPCLFLSHFLIILERDKFDLYLKLVHVKMHFLCWIHHYSIWGTISIQCVCLRLFLGSCERFPPQVTSSVPCPFCFDLHSTWSGGTMWEAFLLMVSSSSLHCPPFDKPPQPQQKKEKKKKAHQQ